MYVPSTATDRAYERAASIKHLKGPYKMTLQNPKPSDDAALRNFSLDYKHMRMTPVTLSSPM